MRRRDREIAEFSEIINVMRRCTVCHVAFGAGEYPYVVPMNFGMEIRGSSVVLYFHGAAEGRKHDLIKENNKAAFVMEVVHEIALGPQGNACGSTIGFECVMGTGLIAYVNGEEKTAALDAIMDQCSNATDGQYRYSSEAVSATAVLKLTVNSLSGKRRKTD